MGGLDPGVFRLRVAELWIPAVISLIVGARWLLGERHSVYGDEAFHLTNLFDGVAAAQGGILDRLTSLYLFNFAYPPVFHLLSAPFVLPAADPVLAGRAYVQVLTLLVCITLYAVTRAIGGKLAGATAVLTVLMTPSFVDVSRHYLLEPLLTLEVLLVLYCIGRYFERPRWRYPLIISAVITLGLLTKFNFFFYAAPLFLVPTLIEARQLLARRKDWPRHAGALATIVLPPLVVAGPWYVARASGSTGMLSTLYEAGTLQAGFTLASFANRGVGALPSNYSPVFMTLAGLAAIIYLFYLVPNAARRIGLTPMSRAQHVMVASALVGVMTVPLILAAVGLGGELRWHVEAVYLLVATFGLIGRLGPKVRLAALGVASLSAALQLLTIYVMAIDVPAYLGLSMPDRNPRPSAVPVGSEEIAHDIARFEKRLGGTKPGDFAFFLYHEHAGPHFGSVEFYLRFEGAAVATVIAGFYDRAIDVSNLFNAKYLFEGAGRSFEWNDQENRRYRVLAQNLPDDFRKILVEVSQVEGRFGRFSVHYVPRERITEEMVLSTIEIGRKLETVEANLSIWDAQRIVWRAKFEPSPGNADLRREIDEFLPRVPSAEAKLLTLNRQMLQQYVVRIQAIRKLTEAQGAKVAMRN